MFWKKRKKHTITHYRCSNCGEKHDELPAIAFATPFYYEVLNEVDKKEIAQISSDFCVIKHPEQTDRFIRTVLTIPINDACENLEYGVWVSLSEKSFDEYFKDFDEDTDEKVYFGMISNEIPGYDISTLGLHVDVNIRKGGIRPEIIPHQNPHRLILDWEKGICLADAENRIKDIQ